MADSRDQRDVLEIRKERLLVNGRRIDIPGITPVRVIGAGASGVVLEVRHRVLGDRRACKIWLKRRLWDTRDKQTQGLAEARKLAQINHPVIVRVHDANILDRSFFYATMEYVEGIPLRDMNVSKVHWRRRVLQIWRPMKDALSYLQGAGTCHGDPHAGNVLVNGDPESEMRVKVIDCGTSYFRGVSASEAREQRVLAELHEFLFPEWGPVRDIAEATAELSAFLTAVDTYTDVRFRFEELQELRESSAADIDYWERRTCLGVAHSLAAGPYVPLAKVTTLLQSRVDLQYHGYFWGELVGRLTDVLEEKRDPSRSDGKLIVKGSPRNYALEEREGRESAERLLTEVQSFDSS